MAPAASHVRVIDPSLSSPARIGRHGVYLALATCAALGAMPPRYAAARVFDAPFYAHVTGAGPSDVAVADLNRDGVPDLVTVNAGAHTISVLLGRGDGTMGERRDFPVGGTFSDAPMYDVDVLVIADIDGDAAQDVLVTTGAKDTTFSVLYGNGDGTFGPPVLVPTGSTPVALAVADFDGDRRLDIAVAGGHGAVPPLPGEDLATLSVFLGDGAHSFLAGTSVPLPGSYFNYGLGTWVGTADFDEDGRADLACRSGSHATLYRGRGDGTFESGTEFELGALGFGRTTIADVNRDGHADLVANSLRVVENAEEGEEGEPSPTDTFTVSVLLGDGRGALRDPVIVYTDAYPTVSGMPRGLVVGDLDGDAAPDLAIAHEDGNWIVVLHGNGDGTFRPQARAFTEFYSSSLALADLDRDSRADLVTTSLWFDQALALLGNGDGTFGPRDGRYDGGGRVAAVAAADLDLDGWPDLVTASLDPFGVSTFLNRGDGSFGTRADRVAPWRISDCLAIADFNRDGSPDVAVPIPWAEPAVGLLLGTGHGLLGDWTTATGTNSRAVAAGDLNRDGFQDLALALSHGWAVEVLLGRGDGSFALGPAPVFGDIQWPVSIAIGDLNEDGNPDLVVGSDGPAEVALLFGAGDGTFPRQSNVAVRSPGSYVVLGDLDRDGHLDLVAVAEGGSAGATISILRGRGDGTFGPPVVYPVMGGAWSAAIGDLDADGHPDLAVGASYGATVLLGAGDGTFGDRTDYGMGLLCRSVAITDVDRDGRLDLIGACENSTSIVVLKNHGSFPKRQGVRLDVHPGSCPNRLNVASRGVTPVALVGDSAFDVRDVDLTSLRLEGAVGPVRSSCEDVCGPPVTGVPCACSTSGPDGHADLVLQFDTEEIARALGKRERGDTRTLTLTGTLRSGAPFEARDCVTLVGRAGEHRPLTPLGSARAATQIVEFELERPATVELLVFDLMGRTVRRLASGPQPAGIREVRWDATGLPSGLYFYRLVTKERTERRKLLILR